MSYWMVPAAWVMIPAVFAGFLHGVTGFGFGMVIMLFLPVAFSMQMATALSQSLSLVLCSCMLFCYRREARLKRVILPLLFYFPCFFLFLTVADRIDTSFLKPALGVLLFFLAVYLFWFSGRASIKANGKTAFLCAFLAAFLDAFFAIGGPPMVLYFLSATEGKKEYLGTQQAFFAGCCIYGVAVRFLKGHITASMIPLIACGTVSLAVGLVAGRRVNDRIDGAVLKKLVYGFIGGAGIITFVMNV